MKKLLVIGIALSLFVSGCGGSKSNVDVSGGNAKGINLQISEKEWVMKELPMPDADEALAEVLPEGYNGREMLMSVAGDTVYRLMSMQSVEDGKAEVEYCVQTLSTPYTEWNNNLLSANTWGAEETLYPAECVLKPYIEEHGSIHLILKGAESYYICEWSKNDCKSRALPANTGLMDMEAWWVTDLPWREGEEEIYVSTMQGMKKYDKDLTAEISSNQTPEGVVFQISRNPFSDKLLFLGADAEHITLSETEYRLSDGGFSVWESGVKEAQYIAKNSNDAVSEMGCCLDYTDCVAWASAKDAFLYNMNGIWWFHMGENRGADEEARKLIYGNEDGAKTYEDASYVTDRVISLREDGSLLILQQTIGNGYMLYELVEQEETGEEAEKQIVEVAITIESPLFEKAVVDFNKQSDLYKVVLRNPDGDWNDYRNRIQAEISAGGGPALLSESVIDLEAAAKQGYLMDLTEEFSEYEEHIVPSVRAAGCLDGRRYGMAYLFQVSTLVANKDVVGDRMGWTLEEAMELTEQSGATTFMHDVSEVTEADLFWRLGLVLESNKSLIDWEKKICHFNSGYAENLLTFVKEYTGKDDPGKNEFQRIYDKELMTTTLYMQDLSYIQTMAALLQNKEVYIGYPTEDGSSGHLLVCSNYMVNQSSSAKEGAVAFLKYLLTDEVQSRLIDEYFENGHADGFPVNKDKLEELFDKLVAESNASLASEDEEEKEAWKEAEKWGNYNGISYEKQPITEEQIKRFKTVLETATISQGYAAEIWDILDSEFPAYLSGSKTAKEVLDVVQNRAQLYINEKQ